MSYNKQTFVKGEALLADDLNQMSAGIASKQDSVVFANGLKVTEGTGENLPVVTYKLNTNIDGNGVDVKWNGRTVLAEFLPVLNHTVPTATYVNPAYCPSVRISFRYFKADKVTVTTVAEAEYCRVMLINPDALSMPLANPTSDVFYGTVLTYNGTRYALGSNISKLDIDTKVAITSTDNMMQVFEHIVCVGDSLTAGFTSANGTMYGSTIAREANRNWPTYLGLTLGRNVINLGYGGASAKTWRYGDETVGTYKEMLNVPDADCFIVGIGFNDDLQGLTLGSISDINDSDMEANANSFYGNYDYLIRTLFRVNSKCHIFMLTMPHPKEKNGPYNEAIRKIANRYSKRAHLIDIADIYENEFKTGPIANSWNGHSIPIMYQLMSVYIQKAIGNYMYVNYDKFLGTPYNGL